MGFYCAMVGKIIIKSEFRADFGYLFRGEYDKLESGHIADYVKEYKDDMLPFCDWKHWDYRDSWKEKYNTSYDGETGLFTYGVAYNRHGSLLNSMIDMDGLLKEITEEEISFDWWDESDYD